MIHTIPLLPEVTLRCFRDTRFKQEGLSLQFICPMDKKTAAEEVDGEDFEQALALLQKKY